MPLTARGRGGQVAATFAFLLGFLSLERRKGRPHTSPRGRGVEKRKGVSEVREGTEAHGTVAGGGCIFALFKSFVLRVVFSFQRRARCLTDIPKCFAHSVPSLVLSRSLIL